MIVETSWGQRLDPDAAAWRLEGRHPIDFGKFKDWSDGTCAPARAVRAFLLTCAARETARSLWTYFIVIEFALRDPDVRAAIARSDGGFILAVATRFATSRKSVKSRIGVLRRWYRFAEAAGFEGFDADAAMMMDAMHVGTPRTGTAVLRQDPEHGPLSNREYERLMSALWRARAERSLPLANIAAALLFATFGVNRENLMKLREADLTGRRDRGGRRILSMPRIKKRAGNVFGTHKDRPLTAELEAVLEELVAENRSAFPLSRHPDGEGAPRPLFMRPPSHWTWGPALVNSQFFYLAVADLPRELEVNGDDGERLHLYPRRLRYTFATRHVAAGRSAEELQELLDHTSIECLMMYYNPRWDLVSRLDATLGPHLVEFAKMAQGSRPIPKFEATPTGADSSEVAPNACLTCRLFHPVKASAIDEIGAVAFARTTALRARPGDDREVARELEAWSRIAANVPQAAVAVRELGR